MPSISEMNSGAHPFGGALYGVSHGAPAQGPSSIAIAATSHPALVNLGDGTASKLGGKHNLRAPSPISPAAAAGLQGELGAVDPDQISTDISTFMAVFAQFTQKMRAAARLRREADMQLQVGALQSAADEIRKAAADRFTGSITQAAMQMGGGLLQAGLSTAATRQAVEGAEFDTPERLESSNPVDEARIDTLSSSETERRIDFDDLTTDSDLDFDGLSYLDPSDGDDFYTADPLPSEDSKAVATVSPETPKDTMADTAVSPDAPKDAKAGTAPIDPDVPRTDSPAVKQAYARANAYNTIAQASNGIVGAVGGFVASPFTQKAEEAEAAKAGLEAQARVHEHGVQKDDAEMQQAMEIIRDIRDKLGAMAQSQLQTNQTIARNL